MKNEHLPVIHTFDKLPFNVNQGLEYFQIPTTTTRKKPFLKTFKMHTLHSFIVLIACMQMHFQNIVLFLWGHQVEITCS